MGTRDAAWTPSSQYSKNLKLDNRPRKLVVRGVNVDDDLLLEHIREWHQASGQADLLTVEDSRDILVQFRTRAAAEQVHSNDLGSLK